MMPAAKHGDPQIGVDIHLCVVPPSPSPVPLPTPHTSIVFDPFDYVPILGATVTVCGMKRAVAGTSGKAIHIPPGFPFAPKIPDTSDEIFMGSATVVADGDPFSFLGVPVLACQVAGMPSPPRPKQHEKKLMLLPTVTNLAIPTSVFVGGPPTISMMGMAFKLGFAALGRFAKSGLFKRMRQKLFGKMKPGFLKCVILRAEPVDITSGEVSIEHEDFTLPGCMPIQWTRSYTSNSSRQGACGTGWETPADIRLEIFAADNSAIFLKAGGPAAVFPSCPDRAGHAAAVVELWDGARLSDHGDAFQVRTKEDRIYHFDKGLGFAPQEGVREYLVTRISDLCGNSLVFERQGRQLARIRESDGRCLEIESDETLVRRITLRQPETEFEQVLVEYAYNETADLVEVRDELHKPFRFAYDRHRLIRHTNRNGLSFHYQYEQTREDWRVVHTWGDGGLYNYRFRYLEEAQEVQITDSLGHVTTVTLDERRLPISELDPLGGVTTYEYDEVGRTASVVDQDEYRTSYEYDDRGNLL
jgi:YD repeat-containing protein